MLLNLGFSQAADDLYRSLVDAPRTPLEDIAHSHELSADQVRAAREELIQAGLLLASWEESNGVVVLDPAVSLERLLSTRNAELARQQRALADAQAATREIASSFGGKTETRVNADAVELVGVDAIRRVLAEWHSSVQHELLAMHPSTSYSAEQLESALEMDVSALARGVKIRSIFTTASRTQPRLFSYHAKSVEHGAQLRYAPNVPMRMLVCDRRLGLVPTQSSDDGTSALLVRSEAIISVLVLIFEQLWSTAEPIDRRDFGVASRDVVDVTDLDRTLLKLLSMGVKDEAAARHLGVSVRTLRRQIASLMDRLEASSRFQAGMEATLRGWIDTTGYDGSGGIDD